MSGIYIKGMEMPEDIEPGLVIEFADGIDGKRYARIYHYRHGGLTEWLEAVPVPPHGRLGDLNRLAKELEDMGKEFPPDSIGAERYRIFAEFIKTAPTIFQASVLKRGGSVLQKNAETRMK